MNTFLQLLLIHSYLICKYCTIKRPLNVLYFAYIAIESKKDKVSKLLKTLPFLLEYITNVELYLLFPEFFPDSRTVFQYNRMFFLQHSSCPDYGFRNLDIPIQVFHSFHQLLFVFPHCINSIHNNLT